jgi:hypothetical protein
MVLTAGCGAGAPSAIFSITGFIPPQSGHTQVRFLHSVRKNPPLACLRHFVGDGFTGSVIFPDGLQGAVVRRTFLFDEKFPRDFFMMARILL